MKRRNFLIQGGIFSASAITALSSNAWIASPDFSQTIKNQFTELELRHFFDTSSIEN
ncbi:hypothetical protein [Nostoc sp.]|uniref:hypothetical protein n=1 Tax=Nostoc sp. TaxID=1180 RepID=UPI002FF93F1A